MEFNIYLRRFEKLIRLDKLSRTSGGLYLIKPGSQDYVTYHEDGKYWIRSRGKPWIKKIREPLSNFKGCETLSMSWTSVFAPMPDDRDELEINLKVEDIILDFAGNFCIEIILSASQLELPKLPERLNSLVFVKNWKPYITIEAFEVLDNIFPSYRYPTKVDWVEGTNYFVNHIGKI